MNSYLRIGAGFLGGILIGIFFHFLLYRISLPLEPFIYFSF
jgi:high-affinity Fe2+/Pb2+ permease